MKLKTDRGMPKMMLYLRIEITIQKNWLLFFIYLFFCTQQLRFFSDSGASHQMPDQRSYFSSITTTQKWVWLVKGIGVVNSMQFFET
jgi:hypothetical protein